MTTPEKGIIKLCGIGACPTVDFTNPEKVVIKDDFGGKVELTPDQWNNLKEQFALPAKTD